MKKSVKRIVILGGGFAGIVTARGLVNSKEAKNGEWEITLVDRRSAYVYTPWLYEVSTGFLATSERAEKRRELFSSAKFGFKNLEGFERIRYRHATVTRVDDKERAVFFEDGLTLKYDVLLLGFGSETQYFGIPGLLEHSLPLKSVDDAKRIEEKISKVLVQAKSPGKRRQIMMVGAGPSGVELVGEIAHTIRALEDRGEIPKGSVQVTLLDRAAQILGSFPPKFRSAIVKRLGKVGVEVKEGMAVLEASANTLSVCVVGDEKNIVKLPVDVCIWSGGVGASEVVRNLPFPHEPRGRVTVDEHFVVTGAKGVFAAGDCAALMNPRTKAFEPQSAYAAFKEGEVVSENIIHYLRGEKLEAFPFRKRWDVLIAVGGKYAVGHYKGMIFSGYFAYLARRFTDLHYFTYIFHTSHAFKVWRQAVGLYSKNDR